MSQANELLVNLCEEYKRAGGTSATHHYQTRTDSVRLARWRGQSESGRKEQRYYDKEKVFPWDGCSDVRCRLTDQLVGEFKDLLVTAFKRGTLRAGATEANDAESAQVLTTLLRYYRENLLLQELHEAASLLADYGQQDGISFLQIGWKSEDTKKRIPMSLPVLQQMALAADPESLQSRLPELIADELSENEAIQAIKGILNVTTRDARKGIKKLRKGEVVQIPIIEQTVNQPDISACRLYIDVFIPPETIHLENARYVFRRYYMSETELRSYGFDEKFVEKVLSTKDDVSHTYQNSFASYIVEPGFQDGMYEIVYAYERKLDEDGMPEIECTVFHPDLNDIEGKKETLDYLSGKYPFIAYRRENAVQKLVETRGLSEICHTWQDEIKTQRDMLADRASLYVNPPIVHAARSGGNYEFRPGSTISEMRAGEIRTLDPPRSSITESIQIIDYVERQCNEYLGRMGPGMDPTVVAIRRQATVDNFMTVWSKAFSKMFQLMQIFLTDDDMVRIAGKSLNMPRSSKEIQGNFDFRIVFDSKELDNDYLLNKMQALTSVALPNDSAGVIDRGALVTEIAKAISPSLADTIVMPKVGVSQKIYQEVMGDIIAMAQGNAVPPKQNDPAAQTKLQFANQIIQSNPKYQEALQNNADERFVQLMQGYLQNLQFLVQQEQNAITGRTGVAPQQ